MHPKGCLAPELSVLRELQAQALRAENEEDGIFIGFLLTTPSIFQLVHNPKALSQLFLRQPVQDFCGYVWYFLADSSFQFFNLLAISLADTIPHKTIWSEMCPHVPLFWAVTSVFL